jgi:hypothetical protein
MLMEAYSGLLERGWQPAFAQARSHHRALQHALAGPCTLGRRTLSRTVCVLGRSDRDWSADYKLFSRSGWEPEALFDPVWDDYLGRFPQGPIPVAFDDTRLPKTGQKAPGAFWQRDPLSPPFHPNLMYGLRFVQASLLFPHHQQGEFSARGFPVRFQEAPAFDRGQIEVNHRDEKDLLGVGQAQLRSTRSVPRHPDFVVASYSLLLLAGLHAFGPGRSRDYPALPKWRRHARRASLLDLLTLLRQELMASNETSVSQALDHNIAKNLVRYANT